MCAEDRRSISSCRHHGRRRAGRIVETLFVILALMCLVVALFGNWFVSKYGGSGGNVAANAAEVDQATNSTADASEASASDGESGDDSGDAEALADSGHNGEQDNPFADDHGHEEPAPEEQDPSVAAAHKLVDNDEAPASEDGSGSRMADSDEDGNERSDDLGGDIADTHDQQKICLLYTSPSPRDLSTSRMPSSA